MADKGLVCVTGAGGFVASWLVKCLLEKGYRVRGTVRDPDNVKKTAHLRSLPGAMQRLQLVKADLLVEGSFDAAVNGVECVFHTASPLPTKMSDPQTEMVDPAINGVLNVLTSVTKAESVKKVVMTSSSSACRFNTDYTADVPLDESSWSSLEFCTKFKLWYPIAKTSAEQHAWEFAKKNGINLVTLCPTFIVGYALPAEMSSTVGDVYDLLTGKKDRFFIYGRMGYVHIDDAITAHILAYEHPEAEGRYVVDSGVLSTAEMIAIITKRYPHLNIPTDFTGQKDMPYYNFDASKLKKLGLEKFKTLEEMFDDAIASFKDKGLL